MGLSTYFLIKYNSVKSNSDMLLFQISIQYKYIFPNQIQIHSFFIEMRFLFKRFDRLKVYIYLHVVVFPDIFKYRPNVKYKYVHFIF